MKHLKLFWKNCGIVFETFIVAFVLLQFLELTNAIHFNVDQKSFLLGGACFITPVIFKSVRKWAKALNKVPKF